MVSRGRARPRFLPPTYADYVLNSLNTEAGFFASDPGGNSKGASLHARFQTHSGMNAGIIRRFALHGPIQ